MKEKRSHLSRRLDVLAYHDIIILVPGPLQGHHKLSGNKRSKQGTNRVARVHEALDGVRLVHGAHPSAEAGVRQPVPKAADDVDHDQHGVGRMQTEGHVGDNVA